MKPVRVGVIGAWEAGRSHRICRISHRTPTSSWSRWRERVASNWKGSRRDSASRTRRRTTETCSRPGVDVCVVSSPAAFHHEHVCAALAAGAQVRCEKPFTIAPEQAWDLVSRAAAADRELIIAFGSNYLPMVTRARALLEEIGIGTLEQISIVMSSTTRELLTNTGSYPNADPDAVPEHATWTDPAVSGGGYGQAQLTHALGLGLWLTGARMNSAFAYLGSPMDAPVELHDAIAFRCDGGAVGVLSGGSSHLGANGNKHALEVRAIGSKGQLQVDLELRDRLGLHRRQGAPSRCRPRGRPDPLRGPDRRAVGRGTG